MISQLDKGHAQGGFVPRIAQKTTRAELVAQALARCEVFAKLRPERFGDLAAACELVRFARRDRLAAQAGEAESLYVVASGRVRIARPMRDGRALTVAYREPGDLLGETALAPEAGYASIAIAVEPVEAIKIALRSFRELLAQSPELFDALLALMVARRIDAERRVQSLLSGSVESRVAQFLLDAADRSGVPDERGLLVGARYTHQEIADYVGSTRETVTLTLGEMRRKELLAFDHRRIVLLRPQALRTS
jgi:CRP-like cAMP-binding protein